MSSSPRVPDVVTGALAASMLEIAVDVGDRDLAHRQIERDLLAGRDRDPEIGVGVEPARLLAMVTAAPAAAALPPCSSSSPKVPSSRTRIWVDVPFGRVAVMDPVGGIEEPQRLRPSTLALGHLELGGVGAAPGHLRASPARRYRPRAATRPARL